MVDILRWLTKSREIYKFLKSIDALDINTVSNIDAVILTLKKLHKQKDIINKIALTEEEKERYYLVSEKNLNTKLFNLKNFKNDTNNCFYHSEKLLNEVNRFYSDIQKFYKNITKDKRSYKNIKPIDNLRTIQVKLVEESENRSYVYLLKELFESWQTLDNLTKFQEIEADANDLFKSYAEATDLVFKHGNDVDEICYMAIARHVDRLDRSLKAICEREKD